MKMFTLHEGIISLGYCRSKGNPFGAVFFTCSIMLLTVLTEYCLLCVLFLFFLAWMCDAKVVQCFFLLFVSYESSFKRAVIHFVEDDSVGEVCPATRGFLRDWRLSTQNGVFYMNCRAAFCLNDCTVCWKTRSMTLQCHRGLNRHVLHNHDFYSFCHALTWRVAKLILKILSSSLSYLRCMTAITAQLSLGQHLYPTQI